MTSILTPRSHGPLPLEPEADHADLASRVGAFRRELALVPTPPAKRDVERMVALARELGLRDADIRDELDELRALSDCADLANRLAAGDFPMVLSLDPLPAGERCHFVTRVRFGRRRTDQSGHLELTTSWLKFHGALDVSVVWSEVADVQRAGHEIVVSLPNSDRLLRFSCDSIAEAARGAVIATFLATTSRAGAARFAAPGS